MTAHPATDVGATPPRPSAREPRRYRRYDEPPVENAGAGPHEHASIEEILGLVRASPVWPTGAHQETLRYAILRGTRRMLECLQPHPGAGWQERWHSSGGHQGMHGSTKS